MMFLTLLASGEAGFEIFAQIVTTIVTFGLVAALTAKLAWKPILAMLDERREGITRQFEEIDKKEAEAKTRLKEYEERLRSIDEEGRQRIAKAVDEGRAVATTLLEQARKDAEEIGAKAKLSMQLELDRARVELRDHMVKLTIQATEKLLAEKLDDQKHRDLVTAFIVDLEKREAS